MSDGKPKCRERIYNGAFRSHACGNAAVTDAGYCRVHDPELKRQRDAKRGPTKFEQRCAMRKQRDELLDAIVQRHPEEAETVMAIRSLIFKEQF